MTALLCPMAVPARLARGGAHRVDARGGRGGGGRASGYGARASI